MLLTNYSQTIMGNFTSELIHYLDDVNGIQWSTSVVRVECEESAPEAGYWMFTVNGVFAFQIPSLTMNLSIVEHNGSWWSRNTMR